MISHYSDNRPLKKQRTESYVNIHIGSIKLIIQFDNYDDAYSYINYLETNDHLYLDYYVMINNKYDEITKRLLNDRQYFYTVK